jgi:phospholipase C
MFSMPSRYSEWNREFQARLAQDRTGGTVPTFMMVRFGRDHTMGTNPGFSTPSAMIADNDYAVGELVQAVSNSPIWSSTAIFVIEDDAQFSPDHVDAHRSFAFIASPWIKKGTVDSRFYDTNSILKSIELLLGLTPMSQYDALADPIMGGWDAAPNNNAPYAAILPAKSIVSAMNPSLKKLGSNDPRRPLAETMSRMNFDVADAVPSQILNEAIWQSVKGPDSTMPEPRTNELIGLEDLAAHRDADGDRD